MDKLPLIDYSPYLNDSIISHEISLCTVGKVYYFYSGRNAWNWTWVHKYPGSDAFNFTLIEAKEKVERLRVQGSTWWIEELPACLFSGEKYSILITEINTETPLKDYVHFDLEDLSIESIAKAFELFKPDSVVRLICSSNYTIDNSKKPLKRFKSFSTGGNYYLSWITNNVSPYKRHSVNMIARKFNKLKKKMCR